MSLRRVAPGLAACAFALGSCAKPPDPALKTVAATRARIVALTAERTRLQNELRGALSEDARLEGAPPGDVMIGLPTSLLERIATEALTGPLRNVRLVLKDVAKFQIADSVNRKTFLGNMTLGRYDLAVDVRQVTAFIRPRKPAFVFGSNRIAVELPVRIESGDVQAGLRFKWDGRKLAGIVCGDIAREHDLRATVPPIAVAMKGRFDVAARGERVEIRPVIAPIDLQFSVEPAEQTWTFIDDLIESKNVACEAALRKAKIGQKLKDLVKARGFKVRLPTAWIRPLSLPAAFRDTVEMKGQAAGLVVTPTGVAVTKTRIWYGAGLTIRRARAGSGQSEGGRPADPSAVSTPQHSGPRVK